MQTCIVYRVTKRTSIRDIFTDNNPGPHKKNEYIFCHIKKAKLYKSDGAWDTFLSNFHHLYYGACVIFINIVIIGQLFRQCI
jgi:hypothetical protein